MKPNRMFYLFACVLVVFALLITGIGCGTKATPAPTATATQAPVVTATPTRTATILAPGVTATATATATKAPTAAPTPTAAVKPIEWKFSSFVSPKHHLNRNVFTPICKEELEKRSGGRIQMTIYHAEALGKAVDQYDIAAKGMADMSFIVQGYIPGRFPLSTIIDLPFAAPSSLIGSKALWEIYKKGYLDKELSEVKTNALFTSSSYQLFFAKKRPLSLADLKGLKIRTPGGYMTKTLEVAGMSVVNLPAAELYLALERGVVDGVPMSYASAPGYKLEEIVKYIAHTSIGVTAVVMVTNKDSYNKLPADLQKVVDSLSELIVETAGNSYDREDETVGRDALLKKGVELYIFPPAERTKWIELCKPVYDGWITEMEGKGLPGRAVYNDFLAIMEKLGAKLPF